MFPPRFPARCYGMGKAVLDLSSKPLRRSFMPKKRPISALSRIVARPVPGGDRWKGRLHAGFLVLPCALGRAGVVTDKREGDHASPRGDFSLLGGFFRSDRLRRPACRLALRPLRREMGWCDDADSFLYNRPMILSLAEFSVGPLAGGPRHEVMWRKDSLYDIVFQLDHNQNPRMRGRGSAIFLHCARPDPARPGQFAPTEGCVALPLPVLRKLLPLLAPHCRLRIG